MLTGVSGMYVCMDEEKKRRTVHIWFINRKEVIIWETPNVIVIDQTFQTSSAVIETSGNEYQRVTKQKSKP